jgi:hypothetical protein
VQPHDRSGPFHSDSNNVRPNLAHEGMCNRSNEIVSPTDSAHIYAGWIPALPGPRLLRGKRQECIEAPREW